MPAKRLSMRKIKEVLRLRAQGRSDREVARSVKVARTTVRRIRRRAEEAGLSWPLPDDLSESALEALLFPTLPPPLIQQPLQLVGFTVRFESSSESTRQANVPESNNGIERGRRTAP
ncbi:MAG: helix-turn-helix domain-containing protein, partial [Gemmatimonadetes bacterium]|nr:helix-turn-helix domain-containing protein [Gemmatimonadota bacterium]